MGFSSCKFSPAAVHSSAVSMYFVPNGQVPELALWYPKSAGFSIWSSKIVYCLPNELEGETAVVRVVASRAGCEALAEVGVGLIVGEVVGLAVSSGTQTVIVQVGPARKAAMGAKVRSPKLYTSC